MLVVLGSDLAHVHDLGLQARGAAAQLLHRLLLRRERGLRCLGRLLCGGLRLRVALAASVNMGSEDRCLCRAADCCWL